MRITTDAKLRRIGQFAGCNILSAPINTGVAGDSNVSDAKNAFENAQWVILQAHFLHSRCLRHTFCCVPCAAPNITGSAGEQPARDKAVKQRCKSALCGSGFRLAAIVVDMQIAFQCQEKPIYESLATVR